MLKRLVVAACLLTLAACSSTGREPRSLIVSPSSVTIGAGEPAATFSAALGGAPADVSWTLDPALGSLSATSGPVVVYTPPDSLADRTDVKLTASMGTSSAQATITLLPDARGTITVTGKVLNYSGDAGAFLPIMVGDQKTATDANGNFSVPNVSTPYDLVVLAASSSNAYIYLGLTRPDPIAAVFLSTDPKAVRKSEVTYTFENVGTSTAPPGAFAGNTIGCASDDAQLSCGVTGAIGPQPFTQTVQWTGPNAAKAHFYALLGYTNDRNVFTDFRGFARDERYLLDDQATSVRFDLQPLASEAISGTTTPPPGYTLTQRGLGFRMSGDRVYPFSLETDVNGIDAAFDWAGPVAAGTSLYLSATATKGDAFVYAYLDDVNPGTSGLTIALPTPPDQSQPVDNALGVTNATVFAWTPVDEGVYTMFVNPVASGPLSYSTFTDRTEAQLPDLSSLGYPLAKGTTYEWAVRANAPVADVDELANGAYAFSYPRFMYSGKRTFTTTP